MPQVSNSHSIYRAPITILTLGLGLPGRQDFPHRETSLKSYLPINLSAKTLPPYVPIQLTTRDQHGIPNLLGGQSSGRKTSQINPIGITFTNGRHLRMSGASLISLTGENQTVQLLDRPPVLHKPIRQPIQQFRVRRLGPHRTKPIWSRHDPPPKMPGPYPVHDHSGSKRIVPRSNPISQGSATSLPRLRHVCLARMP